MGRKFYVSGFKGDDRFVTDALAVREAGVIREGWDRTGSDYQSAGGKGRVRNRDAAVGLDSEDVHMGGDRAVVRAEVPEILGGRPTGDVLQVVDRYSDGGKCLGSYEIRWSKTGERSHTITSKRRVYY